jgi:hypothetical protein
MLKRILTIITIISFINCQEIQRIEKEKFFSDITYRIFYKDGSREIIRKSLIPFDIYSYAQANPNQWKNLQQIDDQIGKGIFDRFKAKYKDWQKKRLTIINN